MPVRRIINRRTRLRFIVMLSVTFAVVGAITAWFLTASNTPSYELSKDIVLSKDGIATNQDNIGTHLAEVELTTLTGGSISTKLFLGSPVVLNIWYSSCEPCRREMPVLAEAHQRYGDKIRFIGINIQDTAQIAKDFYTKYGAEFELYLDTNGRFIGATGIATAPVTLAVNADGVIIDQIAGELSANRLDELVTDLLG
ncbi:MAG: TlpA family protein disulfide reductase [Acidimicrobiaceae bacterium]|nr:TlpA family protein disulfide reductase [Acidimicrobiaceae bacterium]